MNEPLSIPLAHDKPLFTPGPITTSRTVKQAMLRDLGSRDHEFIESVERVRHTTLELAGVSQKEGWECLLMQGSGTFGIESVLGTSVAPQGKLLVVSNGAYGARMATIARTLKIDVVEITSPENEPPELAPIEQAVRADASITHVAMVHCETSTGILNPVEGVGRIARSNQKIFVVDSMSGFGGVPLDLEASKIDFLITSANKCLEGVPGLSIILCLRQSLLECEGRARSVSLDLLDQLRGLEQNGQFRFTPPTHALLALDQALWELMEEGGIEGRNRRYRSNHATLLKGMRAMGFAEYLEADLQSPIITSFVTPDHERFTFEEFYDKLNEKGYVIYPGKVSTANCFRIGSIGRIFAEDVAGLLQTVRTTLIEMGVSLKQEAGSA